MTSDHVNPVAWRIKMLFVRLFDYVIHIPARLFRLLYCLFGFHVFYGKHIWQRRLAATLILVIDVTPASVLFECILDWIKIKTRPLTELEKQIAHTIYADVLPYHLIGIDTVSFPAKRKMATAFATLHTVNFYGALSPATLIHEMMHVWQYRKFGAMYITESIWAQRWGGGYNYGGIEMLRDNSSAGLKAFNFEQQAEIIEDYFRLLNDLPLQWVSPSSDLKGLLEIYVNEVRRQ